MLKRILLALLCVFSFNAFCQQEEQIKQTIDTFFDGMREADSLKIKSTVSLDCILRSVSVSSEDGKTYLNSEEMNGFIKAVTQKREGMIYDERLLSYDIKVDGKMAIAWTPYRFYVNDRFLHCGVNVFSLMLNDDEWEIIGILDTRHKADCLEE